MVDSLDDEYYLSLYERNKIGFMNYILTREEDFHEKQVYTE
jgi:hypothetical protein